MSIGNDSPSAVVTRDLRHVLAQAAFLQERLPPLQASIRTLIDENALLRSQLAELEVSLQALKEENAMLRDGIREERAAVVAYLKGLADAAGQDDAFWQGVASGNGYASQMIERGEHRREEKP